MHNVTIYVDAPIFTAYDGVPKFSEDFKLSKEELIKLWWDFRKGVLVQIGNYMINKMHIVCIECYLWKKQIKDFLDYISTLEEEPELN